MRSYFTSILILLFLMVAIPSASYGQGFLKVSGKNIINASSGQEFYLKGIGLGGWLLQEGYMLHTSDFANAQWQIKEKIRDLIGDANTETFYNAYLQNYVTRADIDEIKKWGFNSIRLPFHYNLFAVNSNPPQFLDKGFQIVDSLLEWCKANQIYLILDMHAAPGGQSDEPISDYNPAFPSLWQSAANRDLTVKIWRKIAERYRSEPWIGGYDLLNEPKWSLGATNQPLRELYIRLTDTIRAVDTNHILYIEGNYFATDFNGLAPAWDNNMVYSFHKYWNTNNQGSIQYLLDLRNNTNRPLWLGETGENSNAWFTDLIELLKNQNIGWAWWPHKKISSIAGPLSAPLTPQYQNLLNYWKGSAPRPTSAVAFNALMHQVEQLKIENCRFQKDVIDAMMRQPFQTSLVPYAANNIPGPVYAPNFDMGKWNYAYFDTDYHNTGSGAYNSGYSYRNEGVDIEPCSDLGSNGYNVGWIKNNEWLTYTLNVQQSGIYSVNVNVASLNGGGSIVLLLDGQLLGSVITVPATGGWQNWQTLTLDSVAITAGVKKLLIKFYTGDFNFSYVDFILTATDVKDDSHKPGDYNLYQNYPNPFNPSTIIEYAVPSRSNVNLSVYSLTGELVDTIVNETVNPGYHKTSFNLNTLAAGVYTYRITAVPEDGSAAYFSTRKMVVLR